ncbi:hypothetical protein EVAR_10926_1 [Eumeta japonica]|uniref:Uncharacterized protein n=1 Tax=Eumeta variegata TaxID=151549 RepID=A0A4C1U617_EUMVA|nr:hypothetical protein EVAR_10926_1 [Eumeta japonica]
MFGRVVVMKTTCRKLFTNFFYTLVLAGRRPAYHFGTDSLTRALALRPPAPHRPLAAQRPYSSIYFDKSLSRCAPLP